MTNKLTANLRKRSQGTLRHNPAIHVVARSVLAGHSKSVERTSYNHLQHSKFLALRERIRAKNVISQA
jgi:hypothetical protein